jgi:hypothetical protein
LLTVRLRLPHADVKRGELAKRDVLGWRHGALKAVADATAQQQARYSRSEIRLVRTLDVAGIRKRLDEIARERRELDTEIQAANWTAELAGRE